MTERMNKDGVAAAFELIVEEIEAVASEIADQGGNAFREKAYDLAQELSEAGKSLQEFRTKVMDLLEEWQSGIDVATRQRFTTARPSKKRVAGTAKPHTKGPKTRLHVTFPDGQHIEEYYAADTFALALRKLGLDRVEGLGITDRNTPLVGQLRSKQYSQRRVDGKYICTHSSTQQKKELLERIAKDLGTSLKVQII